MPNDDPRTGINYLRAIIGNPDPIPLPRAPDGLSPRERMQWKRDNFTSAQKAESLRRMAAFLESNDDE